MNGWIKLHRKLNETSFSNKPMVIALFVHLLINANHKETKFIWNKEEMILKEGQLLVGRKSLSKKTGISEQSIRTALTILKSTNTITSKSTSKFSIISILNWKKYQDVQPANQPSNQQTTNQQLTTYKNDKNDNKLSLAGFTTKDSSNNEDFWNKNASSVLKEKGISDPYVIEKAKQSFISKAKSPTLRSLDVFITKQAEWTPPDEYIDFSKDFPKVSKA